MGMLRKSLPAPQIWLRSNWPRQTSSQTHSAGQPHDSRQVQGAGVHDEMKVTLPALTAGLGSFRANRPPRTWLLKHFTDVLLPKPQSLTLDAPHRRDLLPTSLPLHGMGAWEHSLWAVGMKSEKNTSKKICSLLHVKSMQLKGARALPPTQ